MIGDCWNTSSWVDGSWVDNSWTDTQICTADEIGTVWASNSWEICWCMDTWKDRFVPPTPTRIIEEPRRWAGPPIILYRETDIIPNWQRKREDEEIIIL